MKILVVTNTYPHPGSTSSGMHVKSQLESLKKLGIEIDMLYLDTHTSKLEYLKGIWKLHDILKKGKVQTK